METADFDLAGRNFDHLAFAGEIVGAFAGDLDRRECGGVCMITPVYFGMIARMSASEGRLSDVFVTGPSRSSVERSSPQATVKR